MPSSQPSICPLAAVRVDQVVRPAARGGCTLHVVADNAPTRTGVPATGTLRPPEPLGARTATAPNATVANRLPSPVQDPAGRLTVAGLHREIQQLRDRYSHKLAVYQRRLVKLNAVEDHAGRNMFLNAMAESQLAFEIRGTCGASPYPAISMPLEWPTTDFDAALAALRKWVTRARTGAAVTSGVGRVAYPRLILNGLLIETTPRGKCVHRRQAARIRHCLKAGLFPQWEITSGETLIA